MTAQARRGAGRLVALAGGLVLVAALAAGCQEELTSPGQCPQLCPGGDVRTLDVVLTPTVGRDSTYTGYVNRGEGVALLVSNGFAVSENRAAYRFSPRPDSIEVRDTNRTYTVDSVALNLTVLARDTLVNGLKLVLYRISDTLNASATFPSLDAQLIPENVIDTLVVPDTMNAGTVRRGPQRGRPGQGGSASRGQRHPGARRHHGSRPAHRDSDRLGAGRQRSHLHQLRHGERGRHHDLGAEAGSGAHAHLQHFRHPDPAAARPRGS